MGWVSYDVSDPGDRIKTMSLTPSPLVTISIVSHNQAQLVSELLSDIDRYCGPEIETIVTSNVREENQIDFTKYNRPIRQIDNMTPKGFGANHNAALKTARGKYFCVLNPDIRLTNNPFPELLECIMTNRVGVVAPLVTNVEGKIEDNARRFPTPLKIMAKTLTGKQTPEYSTTSGDFSPDWVGGMFMLIPADIYEKLCGFDERYFLYYEDVDLCARMRLAGYDIRLCTKTKVIHNARRQSHHDYNYLRLHIASMIRFFLSKPFIQIVSRRLLHGTP
jgi:N-acetylglucosaminyl-diphospho-decaprenol L-rhamnosyltransferase